MPRFLLPLVLLFGLTSLLSAETPDAPLPPEITPVEKNPARVAEVVAGQRAEANAAWWGFEENDATACLQAAIDSPARKVVVPNVGKPWIVSHTIRLRSNLELELRPGVVVLAMKGKFLGGGECLMAARDCENITLHGDGATLQMRKEDYTKPPYAKAEWRHTLSFSGCTGVKISGLTLRESGGDGLYLGTTAKQHFCKDVHVQHVACEKNHRQGISVIGAENLVIEDSRFLDTRGTAPEAGIDLEPDEPEDRLVNCVIRRCVSAGNAGGGLLVYLKPLTATSADVSVRFEDCHVSHCDFGLGVGAVGDDGPGGQIEFAGIEVHNTTGPGVLVFDKSAKRAAVRLFNCQAIDTAQKEGSPIDFHLSRSQLTTAPGGITLAQCRIVDQQDRPFLVGGDKQKKYSLSNLHGRLEYQGPGEPRMELGPQPTEIDLQVIRVEPPQSR